MIGNTAVPVQEPPEPNAVLHIGRLVQSEIGAQCGDLLVRRHPHPRPLEHDLCGIARRELPEHEREEADAEEHGHGTHETAQDIAPQYIHFHTTSASETP